MWLRDIISLKVFCRSGFIYHWHVVVYHYLDFAFVAIDTSWFYFGKKGKKMSNVCVKEILPCAQNGVRFDLKALKGTLVVTWKCFHITFPLSLQD